MGTVGPQATNECGWKRGDTTAGKTIEQQAVPAKWMRSNKRVGYGEGTARYGAHEALPHTPPGDKPPETPGPLSLGLDCTEGRKSVKGTLRRQNRPPLTDFLPSEESHLT